MAPATRSRPLPRRVYWFRRLLVLGVAVALVFGIARLLDWSTGGSGGEQAASVSASPGATVSSDASDAEPRKKKAAKKQKQKRKNGGKDELARPEGPCDDSDVLVTPAVKEAHAGSPVKIVLEVTTIEAKACFWEVSPDSVFVNIEGDDGTLWSSQHCPGAVPTESVVPRRERAAKVKMWWNSMESDEGCPSWTPWVDDSGSYTVVAAARGSVTPVATGFLLGGPVAKTVTRTATPTPTDSSTPTDDSSPERRPKGNRDRDRDR